MRCRRLEARLGADGALWKQVWAARVLSRRERELFGALRVPEARQLEWLAARTAAKDGIAELVREARDVELLPGEIEILPDERGRPLVQAPGLEQLGLAASVSLAHARGLAAAFVALVPSGSQTAVGLDLEPFVGRPTGFAEAALPEDERRLLERLPSEAADEWLLRLWCAREAAGKALGSGLNPRLGAPTVTSIDPERERVQVALNGHRLLVRTSRDQSLIVATTVSKEEDG